MVLTKLIKEISIHSIIVLDALYKIKIYLNKHKNVFYLREQNKGIHLRKQLTINEVIQLNEMIQHEKKFLLPCMVTTETFLVLVQ